MKKTVWIFNHYAGNTFFEHGGRHYNFAKYLQRTGYAPVIFCCNAKHNSDAEQYYDLITIWEEHIAEEIKIPFVFVKGRAYTRNGKQRVLNMVDFYRNVKKAAKEYAQEHGKPDVILASSVHPLTVAAGIQLAKHFGVKCICEVRDLWPESIIAFGIAGPYNPAVIALRRLEKWIYTKANAIIFTMEGAYDYIIEQNWEKEVPRDKVHYINNGVDLETFDYNKEHYRIDDPDLENAKTFKVIYAGSVRPANGLNQLIGCAEKLRDRHDICFLIYGGGKDLQRYRDMCTDMQLKSCLFKGPVEKKYIPYILSKADLNVLNYNLGSAQVFRFGSSNNKLFEYLASGKPILTNSKINYCPIDRYECGQNANLPTSEAYAEAVLRFYNMSREDYEKMCRQSRNASEEYDYKHMTKKLVKIIEGIHTCDE